jgi:hypothetical protein
MSKRKFQKEFGGKKRRIYFSSEKIKKSELSSCHSYRESSSAVEVGGILTILSL